MGKIPIVLLAIVVLWVALTVAREGPEHAFGGLFAMLASPQYGEADRSTRSGNGADRAEDPAETQREEADPAWWAEPK